METQREMTNYERSTQGMSYREKVLFFKKGGWDIKPYKLSICEYTVDEKTYIDFLLKKEIPHKGVNQKALIFLDLEQTLTGALIEKNDGSNIELTKVEIGPMECEDIQSSYTIDLNCYIENFVEYNIIVEYLLATNKITEEVAKEPEFVLEYFKENYANIKSQLQRGLVL